MHAHITSFALLLSVSLATGQATELVPFNGHTDIGHVNQPGTVHYDTATSTFLVAGSGANMWATNDAFHYV